MRGVLTSGLLLLLGLAGPAQYLHDPVIHRAQPITVLGADADTLDYPFAGGLNNCQYGAIDLNQDGIKDLVVFDRHGNRLLTFINQGIPGVISYSFDPSFAEKFPPLREWMQLIDYNADGREDIFTYTTGGIKVFRNESGSSLKFTQVTFPYLVSMQGSSLTNILVTYADYPALKDIDGDGDLDILTFWGLGSFVEWHKNMSMERYGTADSLEFVKSSNCWGRFAEAGESNGIILDTCVNFDNPVLKNGDPKHTGSTLLASDFTGDGLAELVIGDVDFSTLMYLTNGGTPDTAVMIAQTPSFPDNIHPVNLTSFPAAGLLDVNNDGLKDLLVSPFDPSLIRSENSHSSWLYLNSGKKSFKASGYNFQQDDFLQGKMLDFGSGAYPVLFDYDADGLTDLIVGNFGRLDSSWYTPANGLQCEYVSSLALLRNIGTSQQPAFKLITTDYLGLSSLRMQSLIPAIGDLDGDGDADLLCGNSKGKFVYLENTAQPGQPAAFTLADPAYRQLDVGDFSAPQILDIDNDGLNDIVSGKRNGRLSYFRNTGPLENPQFTLVTDSLGGVDVTNTSLSYFGYSVPFFYKETDEKFSLLVGSEFGEIFIYRDIEDNIGGKFTAMGILKGMQNGWRTGITIGALDSDTVPDVFVGNYSGGLGYYNGLAVSPISIDEPIFSENALLKIFPNPANNRIQIDLESKALQNEFTIQIRYIDGHLSREIHHVDFPYQMDVSRLRTGAYIITAKSKRAVAFGKLLILR